MANYIKTLYEKLEDITPLNDAVNMAKKPFPSIERFVLLIFPELNPSDEALLKKCIKETRQQSDVIRDDFRQWEGMSFHNKLLEAYDPDYFKHQTQELNSKKQKEAEIVLVTKLTEFIEDSIRRISGKRNVTQLSDKDMATCVQKIDQAIHAAVSSICAETGDLFFYHHQNAFYKNNINTIYAVTHHLYSYLRYALTHQFTIDALNMGVLSFAEDLNAFFLKLVEMNAVSFDDVYSILNSMADPYKYSSEAKNYHPNSVVLAILITFEHCKLLAKGADLVATFESVLFYLRKLEQYNPAFPYVFFYRGLIQYTYAQKKRTNPELKIAEFEYMMSKGLDNYYLDTLDKLTKAGKLGNSTANWIINCILEDELVPRTAKEAFLGISNSKENKDALIEQYLIDSYEANAKNNHMHSTYKVAEKMIKDNAPLNKVVPVLEKAINLGSTDAVMALGKIYAGNTRYYVHDQQKAEFLFSKAYTMLQNERKLDAALLILELYRKNKETTIPIANMTIQNEYTLMGELAMSLGKQYAECYDSTEKRLIDADIRLCNQLLDKIREKM